MAYTRKCFALCSACACARTHTPTVASIYIVFSQHVSQLSLRTICPAQNAIRQPAKIRHQSYLLRAAIPAAVGRSVVAVAAEKLSAFVQRLDLNCGIGGTLHATKRKILYNIVCVRKKLPFSIFWLFTYFIRFIRYIW